MIAMKGSTPDHSRIHLHLYRQDRERLDALYAVYQDASGLRVSQSHFLRWLLLAVSDQDIIDRTSHPHQAGQSSTPGEKAPAELPISADTECRG